ncbi:MAG: type VI secretion system Vgr family protein [Pseudomonadales bacterium]
MSEVTQTNAPIAMTTALGADVLVLDAFTGTEELGRLFCLDVEAISADANIDPDQVLGTNVTIRMLTYTGGTRYLNGYVSEFCTLGSTTRHARYGLKLQPWLWFLDQTSDCRIFQDMSVVDVITTIFQEQGFTHFRTALAETYQPREYCVQYCETTFSFISRLMEKEGIYYYFEHEDGKHTLVICDSVSAHSHQSDYENVPLIAPGQTAETDHIYSWQLSRSLQPTRLALSDYNFKNPKQNLLSRATISREHEASEFEMYDYPGHYDAVAGGDRYARIALEQRQSRFNLCVGEANARGLVPGMLFNLTGHPADAQNAEYLLVKTHYDVRGASYEVEQGSAANQCTIRFTAMGTQETFRSEALTPWPVIPGPQSALVTGPAGEEIHTDEHGRIKIHFYWDRYSNADENSSCWIRVVQRLAGQNYGSMMLPRIGQECVVEFMDGNPDRPVVTGSIYNGDNQPPYKLPDNKSISGVKTNSTRGGGGANEIRFEDKKDDEQLFVQAQRNLDVRVKNSRFENVGGERHLTVNKDKFEEVEGERHETIGKDHHESVGGVRHLMIGKSQSTDVSDTLTLKVGGDVHENFGKDHSLQVSGKSYVLANELVIEAQSSITINVGESYIAIDNTGVKISTPGSIEFDAKMELKGKGGIGAKVEGGVSAELKSGAMTSVSGALVKIN